jgi:hypothetical protein
MAVVGKSFNLGGKLDIPSAGTAVQLTSTQIGVEVLIIEADEGNGSKKVYVGDSSVSATKYATVLAAGESITLRVSSGWPVNQLDISTVYVDTSSNGADVQWSYM